MDQTTFQSILKTYQQLINTELEKYLDHKIAESAKISSYTKLMAEHIKEFTLRGGKRIRPILVIMGYQSVKKIGNIKDLISFSLCVELMETFLLIHDDIIDQDDLRRGKPTFHKLYNQGKEFGESMALMAGDIAASFGTQIILESNFSDKIKSKALQTYTQTIIDTIEGELLDVMSSHVLMSEMEVSKIHDLKTGRYTFENPLKLGAILAGSNTFTDISRLSLFFGQAYQLTDDIMGIFGNEKKLGKPVGGDIKEGKRTILILKALAKASAEEKRIMEYSLGNKNITFSEIEKVRAIVTRTGSREYSRNLSKKMVQEAQKIIMKSEFQDEAKDFLLALGDFIIEREH